MLACHILTGKRLQRNHILSSGSQANSTLLSFKALSLTNKTSKILCECAATAMLYLQQSMPHITAVLTRPALAQCRLEIHSSQHQHTMA
jgi:hypothetical protein